MPKTGVAGGGLRFYLTVARMSLRRNLQYRGQHMINNAASAVFGFIYIALWQSVAGSPAAAPGQVGAAVLAHYIAVNQCLLWVTTFDRSGLELAAKVRDGTIGTELMRPVSFFWMQAARIYGIRAYNFVFRSLVLAAVFWLAVGLRLPEGPARLGLTALAWVMAAHVGTMLTYFIGLAGFWTTDVGWMYLSLQMLNMFLGGASIPLHYMPSGLAAFAKLTPFACVGYLPTSVWLGWAGAEALIPMAFWSLVLPLLAAALTKQARRRAEVVGG
ncbi:MAG: ABC-2 family transporter protein [Bacillota bacterium]|nr:ABC-2 family transporter protein [Bacillota bacterium]